MFRVVYLLVGVAVAKNLLRQEPIVGLENPENPVAILNTSMGEIQVELFLDKSPITVSNFINLAVEGFYNGLHFHRVIPGFMDQFGCPHSKDPHSPKSGTGGPKANTEFMSMKDPSVMHKRNAGGNIPDECDATHSNEPGTLSMANTGAPESGGSQFFMNVADNKFLDCFDKSTQSNHPVFGKILKNYALAVQISKVKTKRDVPVAPIKMISIEITGAPEKKGGFKLPPVPKMPPPAKVAAQAATAANQAYGKAVEKAQKRAEKTGMVPAGTRAKTIDNINKAAKDAIKRAAYPLK